MPFSTFFRGTFSINKYVVKRNSSCLFYLCVSQLNKSFRQGYSMTKKNGDTIVDSSQAKFTIQTGNLCYYWPSMSTSLILWMCRIKGAQSLVTHGTSKSSFQPHHQHKSYVQQCMLRQDTLTVLRVQHILRDRTGGLRGQESQPKSLALHADHFRSIFVPPSCDFGFELVPSDLRITS